MCGLRLSNRAQLTAIRELLFGCAPLGCLLRRMWLLLGLWSAGLTGGHACSGWLRWDLRVAALRSLTGFCCLVVSFLFALLPQTQLQWVAVNLRSPSRTSICLLSTRRKCARVAAKRWEGARGQELRPAARNKTRSLLGRVACCLLPVAETQPLTSACCCVVSSTALCPSASRPSSADPLLLFAAALFGLCASGLRSSDVELNLLEQAIDELFKFKILLLGAGESGKR
jgi:hypothetical protein